ncbi:DNA-binding protein Fis [Alkalibacillus filiformis]|uniref:DNA-binding protein Fis n=1 Tax=Alkalibacillus filiformis TaxID=200990 RepID=A0ABU0DS96_9BACI|nr:sigma-54-dependent transcriptional regulator [Alkalibacillus filiformis]MDQ0351323.1 DNA-binding protein Fis [Alkalibacillus filiformis]
MNIKVKFIAPYASMVPLIEECRDEIYGVDLSIEVGNMEEGARIACRAEEEGYDVIISRAVTAHLIREMTNIPVIDVSISGYDLLRVLTMANDFDQKKAIVCYPTMTLGAQAIIDILDLSVDVFTIEHIDEIEPTVIQLKELGYELILGDVGTSESAKHHGLESFLIQTGRETVIDAIDFAKKQYEFYEWNLSKIELLSDIIHKKYDDFMIVNRNGEVLIDVWDRFSSCPIDEEEIMSITKEVSLTNKINWRYYVKENEQVDIKIETLQNNGEHYFLLSFFTNNDLLSQLSWVQKIEVKQKPTVIAESEAMSAVMRVIHSGLETHNLFFLVGDPGTGRGLLAQYMHDLSQTGKTFLEVDLNRCQYEYLDELLASHVGTIYLRHTSQLAIERLNLLSRFLNKAIEANIKVVLSVTESLLHRFDSRLSYKALEIFVPSINEREEDLKGLLTLFVAHFHQNLGTSVIKVQGDVVKELAKYDWPGQVRELRSFIQTVVLAEKGYVLKADHVKRYLKEKRDSRTASIYQLEGTLEDIEIQVIESVLEEENYNQSRAAKRLGINRSTLWRKLKRA